MDVIGAYLTQPASSGYTTVCPHSRVEFANYRTGEIIVLYRGRCRRNVCTECVRWKLGFIHRAIAQVRPATLLTIADLEGDPAQIRVAWARFRRYVRQSGRFTYEDLYTIEPHANGLLHVHALILPRLTESQALAAAEAAGLGSNVDVRPITFMGGLSYVLKRATDSETLASHLTLNGRRLFNTTRGFWAGPDGTPTPGGYMQLGRTA
jgi:hypothetical protein